MSGPSARPGRHVQQCRLLGLRRWSWVARAARSPWRRPRHRADEVAGRPLRFTRSDVTRSGVVHTFALPLAVVAVPISAGPPLAVADLPTVIGNATNWLIGILAVLATFFLTLGGARYLTAGGDPAEVEKAKTSLKSAGIGYALALLAPVILKVLQQILGVG